MAAPFHVYIINDRCLFYFIAFPPLQTPSTESEAKITRMPVQIGHPPIPAVCAPLPLTAVALPRLCTCFHFFYTGSSWHPRPTAEASSLPPSPSWTRQKKTQAHQTARQAEEPRSSEAPLTFDPPQPPPSLPSLLRCASASADSSLFFSSSATCESLQLCSKSHPTTIRTLFQY